MTGAAPRTGPIVIVGSEDDEHVVAVSRAVRERGVVPVLLDSLRFPERTLLALGAGMEEILVDGIPLGRPAAVYLRSLYLSPLAFGVDSERMDREMKESWRTTLVVFREKAELLVSVLRRWEEQQVPIYNPLSVSDALRKPHQLARLRSAGLPVPDTLWTNDPGAVRRFAEGRRVAYKPVAGGAATRELLPEDLEPRRLQSLANAPVTFQELLPGEDIRVYVLDGEVVAGYRIESEALDFRQHEQKVESIAVDAEVAGICVRATELVGLRFTGMDLKMDSGGKLRILELNSSPMFLGFDHLGRTDVLGKLADALVRPVQSR